jgi:hypothetical protein
MWMGSIIPSDIQPPKIFLLALSHLTFSSSLQKPLLT